MFRRRRSGAIQSQESFGPEPITGRGQTSPNFSSVFSQLFIFEHVGKSTRKVENLGVLAKVFEAKH